MLITTQKELMALMPTEKWLRVERLQGWIEEEETVNLLPLLGQELYQYVVDAYRRLMVEHGDITPATITPDGKVRRNQPDAYVGSAAATIEEMTRQLNGGGTPSSGTEEPAGETEGDTETGDTENTSEESVEETAGATEDSGDVSADDMATIGLIRLCQQIAFYYTLAHKSGLLTVSFNEGGGMNVVTADNYGSADKDRIKHVTQDAYMSARRSVDTLLLTLEQDARTKRRFTAMWKKARYFYLRKDLLFTTARVMQDYVAIDGSREKYVELVKDIRFCQRTYLVPKIGATMMKTLLAWVVPIEEGATPDQGQTGSTEATEAEDQTGATEVTDNEEKAAIMDETVDLLRTALAWYVLGETDEKYRKEYLDKANMAMGQATDFIKENGEAYGEAWKRCPLNEKATADATKEGATTDVGCSAPNGSAARTEAPKGRRAYDPDRRDNAAFALFAGFEPDPWN